MSADEVQQQPSLSTRDFKAIKNRFLTVNAARLERARAAMRPRQRDFLDLLPLLFHINHPMLPGFVSKDTPAGICNYRPQKAATDAVQRLARSFNYRKQGAVRSFDILALYFMGSAGTVAYSDDSDFDVWLCHKPELDEQALDKLQQKAVAIEQWAQELDLEVHFFLVDHERFRRGELTGMSEESSGSAQHSLLLDEFYRTGLLLAGFYPLWWLVPPDRETDYESVAEELKAKRYRHTDDHIDFGGLAEIPAEEFLGAALWQLYKGIDAPYKSVLKLSLIEAYASEHPNINLLSFTFKRAVFGGEEELDRIDPYVLMLQKVEAYFSERDDSERLDLTRRCFYFKVGMRISDTNPRRDVGEWQRRLLMRMIEGWQWNQADLVVMDSRDSWKVHRVSEERRILFEALSASYRFLSDFARKHAGLSMINQRDLNILGRKLYAAFERKAGKIELLRRGIPSDLSEDQLSIHQIAEGERQGSWLLFRGLVKPEDRSGVMPLRRSRSLIELIAWCYFNGVMTPNSAVALYPRGAIMNLGDFRALVDTVRSLFPEEYLAPRSMEDFGRPARAIRDAIFVNIGVDLLAMGRQADVASSRSDPLSYGGRHANLVLSIDQILVNSWLEVLTFRFTGQRAMIKCLCEHLKWAPPQGEAPVPVAVRGISSFGGGRGGRVTERIEQLFMDVTDCFYGSDGDPDARYILAVGDEYHALYFDGNDPSYTVMEGFSALLRELGRPQRKFSRVVFDRLALAGGVLPLIYERNAPGIVQFFYRPTGDTAEIYVLDERGSLFCQRSSFHDSHSLISQFSRFFEAILNRINFLMQEGKSLCGPEGIEFYEIERTRPAGPLQLERKVGNFGEPDRHYLSLQVIVDVGEDGKTGFTLYCDGREFSMLEYGPGLFHAVVQHILQLRRSGERYPVYITDIELSRAALDDNAAGRMQTVHFLSYKRRIEEYLNRSMGQTKNR